MVLFNTDSSEAASVAQEAVEVHGSGDCLTRVETFSNYRNLLETRRQRET